jgi:cytidyltransferase-like protein
MATIWGDVSGLRDHLERTYKRNEPKIVLTSGGFDPLHFGHVNLIQQSKKLFPESKLVVIVNGDGFLMRKKGKVFMPENERLLIIAALAGVDYVVRFDDGSQFVAGAIRVVKPHYFTKGGDRSTPESIADAEHLACQETGTEIVYGVGGTEKVQSSSWLVDKVRTTC